MYSVYLLQFLLWVAVSESLFLSTPIYRKSSALSSTVVTNQYEKNVMNTYGRYPLVISKGKGVYLYDDNGKEYIDCAAGIATCCLGHANPKLTHAITEQMEKIHHCSNLYYIPEQAKLAEWLVKNSCADKAFFCNSGAEANEGAIKLARKYAHTKMGVDFPVIITAVNSFHGRTLTAITATGQPKYQKDFGPLTPGFEYVEYNNLQALQAKVKEINGRGSGQKVAAIMMEALQGEGGIRPGDKSFFQGIRKLCDETGALMIVDEVQTGIGRTGKMWGYENLGVEPDVFTSAKALGGGIPIGAMCCKDKCNVFGPGDHASTYGGNPLACAAGLAVAKAIEEDKIIENAMERGSEFRSLVNELKERYPEIISDVRGWGLINGMEISAGHTLTAADVTKALMADGVLVVPAGPKVVRFVPPLVITSAQIKLIVAKLEKVIQQLASSK
jgi:acetylornithine/N-succinyldiaminopimelate aminotransferase